MKVYEKMLGVMKQVEYLKKDGFVTTGSGKGYKALTDEKVLSAIRPALINAGLVMIPVAMKTKRTDEQIQVNDNTRVNRITDVEITFRIVNVDDPTDYIEIVSAGTGVDTQDKGIGKAMTYAKKYALLNSLLIPSGDDTDQVSSDRYTEMLQSADFDEKKVVEEIDRNTLIAQILTLAQKANLSNAINEKGYKGQTWDVLSDEQLGDLKVWCAEKVQGQKK